MRTCSSSPKTDRLAWLQLSFRVPRALCDAGSDLCLKLGAAAVYLRGDELAGEVLEPKPGETIFWERADIFAQWAVTQDLMNDLPQIRKALHQWMSDSDTIAEISAEWLSDDGIAAAAPEPLPARCFGGTAAPAGSDPAAVQDARLCLVPAADSAPAAGAAALLQLVPGLAFGTGAHPTTALCLDALARLPLAGARVLDYGCGSGVLAIAAVLLGAGSAVAVDYDQQALDATRRNAADNDCSGRLEVCLPQAFEPAGDCHVVVANILANPLIELAPRLQASLAPGGTLILAGLLAEQAGQVRHAYAELNFAADLALDGWVRLMAQRALAPVPGEADSHGNSPHR